MLLPTSVAPLEHLDIEPAGVQVAPDALRAGRVGGFQVQSLGFMGLETFDERVVIDQCFPVAPKTKEKL